MAETRRPAARAAHHARRPETADIYEDNVRMMEQLRDEREKQLLIREILKAMTAEATKPEHDH